MDIQYDIFSLEPILIDFKDDSIIGLDIQAHQNDVLELNFDMRNNGIPQDMQGFRAELRVHNNNSDTDYIQTQNESIVMENGTIQIRCNNKLTQYNGMCQGVLRIWNIKNEQKATRIINMRIIPDPLDLSQKGKPNICQSTITKLDELQWALDEAYDLEIDFRLMIGESIKRKNDLEEATRHGEATIRDLSGTTKEGEKVNFDLGKSIYSANDIRNELSLLNISANKTNDTLNKTNETANNTNNELNKTNNIALTTKSYLDKTNEMANKTNNTLNKTNETANNINTQLNKTNETANNTKTNLEKLNSDANNTNNKLNKTNDTSKTNQENLEKINSIALATNETLNTTNKKANETNETLNNSIKNANQSTTNANNSKKALDESINLSANKKKELDNSINISTNKKNDLDGSINTANSTKQALESTNSKSIINKENLDKSNVQAEKNINALNAFGDAADLTKKVATLEDKVLKDNLMPIETDSSLTKLHNCTGGFVRNMRIRGRTLQNVIQPIKNITFKKIDSARALNIDLIKLNADYSFILDLGNVIGGTNTIHLQATYSDGTIEYPTFSGVVNNIANNITVKKVSFKKELSSLKLAINVANADDVSVTVNSLMVIEGDWTSKEIPPYFEGIKSTGESEGNKISILAKPKNLFDNENIEQGTSTSVLGKTWNDSKSEASIAPTRLRTISLIAVKSNTQYQLTQNGDFLFVVKEFDVNGIGIKDVGWDTYRTFTTLPNTKYLALMIKKQNDSNILPLEIEDKNIQLEEGTTATQYVSGKGDKTTILLSSPHAGLPDGTANIVDVEKNERIVNVGKTIFNGSDDENWKLRDDLKTIDGINLFQLDMINSYKPSENINFICDKLLARKPLTDGGGFANAPGEFISFFNRTDVNLMVLKIKCASVSDLKAKLKANPVTIYYQLVNPVIEKLEIKDTLQAFEDGYIQLDNAITPTTHLEYSTNLPSMINKSVEVTDKLVDNMANVQSAISDNETEINEARGNKNTINERLEDDKKEILNKIGDTVKLKTIDKSNLVNAINELDLKKSNKYDGNITDFNSALTQGEYKFDSSAINGFLPTRYGKLIVIVSDGGTHDNKYNWIWQIVYYTSGEIGYRYKFNNNPWNTWHEIAQLENTNQRLFPYEVKTGSIANIDELNVPGVYQVQDAYLAGTYPEKTWANIYVTYISHDKWLQQLWVGQLGNVYVRYSWDDNHVRHWNPWKQLATTTTGLLTYLNGWQGAIGNQEVVKCGNMVNIAIVLNNGSTTAGSNIAQLPSGFRPNATLYFIAKAFDSTYKSQDIGVLIYIDGRVVFDGSPIGNTRLVLNHTFYAQ